MYEEQAQINNPKDKQARRDELILGSTGSDDRSCVYHCTNRMQKWVYISFYLKTSLLMIDA